tara:strand:- start:113 stop:526 length:414 start_codon:yes stop_codon:yes gene_type:complete
MIINKKKYPEYFFSGTALLLHISKADDIIQDNEINLIKNIIEEFFKVSKNDSTKIIKKSLLILEKSTDIYELGTNLNSHFNYQDKIDFICCAFEVAYADSKLHYLEEHFIKTISSILNVEQIDLIKSKNEIRNYLEL